MNQSSYQKKLNAKRHPKWKGMNSTNFGDDELLFAVSQDKEVSFDIKSNLNVSKHDYEQAPVEEYSWW